jgi:hypothetical protein
VTNTPTSSPLQRPQTNSIALFYPISPPNPSLHDNDVSDSQQRTMQGEERSELDDISFRMQQEVLERTDLPTFLTLFKNVI